MTSSLHYFLRIGIFSIAIIALAIGDFAPISAQTQITATVDPYRGGTTGWTVFTPSGRTQIIYVSNSVGNDRNDGHSMRTPVKTIARGLELLRDGYPDWLLLKKGDVWTDEIFTIISKNGHSATEPMLLSSYGTGARPLIKTKPTLGETAIQIYRQSNANFLAIVGLEFYAYTRDPNSPDFNASTFTMEHSGTKILSPLTWLLIEDCKFSFYQGQSIQGFKGVSTNITLRRNVFVDATNAAGLYVSNVVGLVIEENVFDHNGWNASVPGAEANIRSHNLYIQSDCGPVILKGNIFANASSHGSQVRPGGTVTNNLYVRNPLGLLIGGGDNPPVMNRKSIVTMNVITEANDIPATPPLPRGFGIDVGSQTGDVHITGNILAHVTSSQPDAGALNITKSVTGVEFTGNIVYAWKNPVRDFGIRNVTAPNSFDAIGSNKAGYPDPDRSVGSYNSAIGGTATLDGFLKEARLQSKDYWRQEYTANAVNSYIRKGFGL